MKVEIWSDVVCPWCYIGKRRFERALEAFDGADDVEVHWRAFQLNPDQPRGARTTHDEYLAAKLRTTVDQVHQLNERVVSLAAAEGLAYDFDRYQVINTLDAHRVAYLGKAHGLEDAIQERLLRGQLVRGRGARRSPRRSPGSGPRWGSRPTRSATSSRATPTPRRSRPTSTRPTRSASTACRSSSSTGGTGSRAPSPPSCSSSALQQASAEAAAAG